MLILIIVSYLGEVVDYDAIIANDDLPLTTRLYSSDLHLISEFSAENRIYVPMKFIPQHTINAFISAEDRTFYTNIGVDIKGILRSVAKNISQFGQKGNKMVGGSTITQQVVKNYFLTSEKTLNRKIKEAILSLKINTVLSKDQIMELYLNKIFFGSRAYGIASASLKYFNKSVNDLTIAESALLASLPQSPSLVNPIITKEKSLERRNWVLSRMYENDFITDIEYKTAMKQPINIDRSHSKNFIYDDFFVEEVRKEIANDYGKDMLYKGGMYVHTTMNMKFQELAKKALKDGLMEFDAKGDWRGPIGKIKDLDNWCKKLDEIDNKKNIGDLTKAVVLNKRDDIEIGLSSCQIAILDYSKWNRLVETGDVILTQKIGKNTHVIRQVPEINGGIIVVDINTGKILALVGGYDYTNMQYNFVTQAYRQAGSILKPAIYLSSFLKNVSFSTIINDESFISYQGLDIPLWMPKNYENRFFGDTTIPAGLALSRNMVTLQLTDFVGIRNILRDIHKNDVFSKANANYSFVLGAEETTLFDMVKYYTMIANGGKEVNLSMIEKIQDAKGRNISLAKESQQCDNCILYIRENDSNDTAVYQKEEDYTFPNITEVNKRLFNEELVYQIIQILEGSVKFGTSKRLKSLGITLASKTGTSNDNKDAWVIGFTPKIVVGVYVGHNDFSTLGSNATGARVAVPVFYNFFQSIKSDMIDLPFKTPPNIDFIKMNTANGDIVNYQNISEQKNKEQILWYAFNEDVRDIILNMDDTYKVDIIENREKNLISGQNDPEIGEEIEVDIITQIINDEKF
ncbi:PBP1A family penicillin-binding protein [Anaplasmataceae bacterium AB001_6]|nr:PBP1A family penicillin-binding protein [Anaplasmataceae bacterium AB001_6]